MGKAATKACPFCAETIKAAAVLCRYCGSKLPLAGEPAVPPPVLTPAPPAAPSDAAALHRSEVLDLLTALVQKSLVVYEEDEQGQGTGAQRRKGRLLETVRQYARDRLLEAREADAVQERQRDWFLALAAEAEPELTARAQVEWLARLEREHDNLSAALEWLMRGL